MAFTSLSFVFFFTFVFCLYFLLPHRFRWVCLLGANLFFYIMWKPVFVLFPLTAAALAYYVAIEIERTNHKPRRQTYLSVGIVLLAGNLLTFKYVTFIGDSFRSLFEWLHLPYLVPAINLLIPIGISFYTFQLVSYLIDVYAEKISAEKHFGLFTVYLLFFPHVVAGPITRAATLLPQLRIKHDFDYAGVADGLKLMAWGFFKKVVVADRLALLVQQVYGRPQAHEGVALTIATLLFAMQVYCDFSGYSDIAIGGAQTLGFKLTKNFDRPYSATSIQEFWKRWHISLTTWLTDYIYTPLTRSKWIRLRWYKKFLLSLFLTFVVSGLWHGAQWTFVAWGALHGTYLVTSMLTQKLRRKGVELLGLDRVPAVHRGLRIIMTFTLVCISYVFFRASSLTDAVYVLTHLFTGWGTFAAELTNARNPFATMFRGADLVEIAPGIVGIAVVLLAEMKPTDGNVWRSVAAQPAWLRWTLYHACIAMIVLFGAYSAGQQFIYFQF